jgi:class 3 adenylate cyclase
VPGRIQVSEPFHGLTKEAFEFEERGTTAIKGLDAVKTYFLVRQPDRGAPARAPSSVC